jgi:preprotein translocase subunit YajC
VTLLLVTRLAFALPVSAPAPAATPVSATPAPASVAAAPASAASASAGSPAAQPPPQGGLLQMLPLILIMGFGFYLFVIMPGNKQRKQMQALLDNLKVGDRVLLNSGIYGRVHQLKEDTLSLRVAESVHIEVAKSAISKVITEEQGNGK